MKLTEKNMCYIDSLSYAQMLDHWRNAGPGDFWLEGETSSYWIERMNNLSHIPPPAQRAFTTQRRDNPPLAR